MWWKIACISARGSRILLLKYRSTPGKGDDTHLKNGLCPRCNTQDVHTSEAMRHKSGQYSSNTIPLSFLRSIPLSNYVCGNCGYVESYVADPEMLSRIKDIWVKVEPNG